MVSMPVAFSVRPLRQFAPLGEEEIASHAKESGFNAMDLQDV
jgi:hypothetical protein